NTQVDRHFWVGADGLLSFGATMNASLVPSLTNSSAGSIQELAGGQRVIKTPATRAVNDNAWHHAVATLGSGGATMYLDGNIVLNDSAATSPVSYTGFWKVAGETITQSVWPNPGTTDWLTASVDEMAVWNRVLTATEVNQLWRRGANRLF
ncbi:LamG-like jellyroll fold domain-containing protein, partial [Paraburkholderia azotifigens]|uniref:LamG-like jellyroll fold domain-containing protein n=1 Tax=Paraburkholderia azotifigens TaxID=2057004 RepID=UPI00317933DB